MIPQNKKYLLLLARRAITKYLQTKVLIELETSGLAKELMEKKAAFVTLKKNHNLRGCIGNLEPQKPLYQSVIDNSLASAFADPRFSPVAENEMPNMNIEISILSPLKQVPEFKSQEELLNYLDNKKPGLLIKKDGCQATFLPQVWEELVQPKDFLSQLCLKAGLTANEWQKSNLKMFEYQAEILKD